MTSSAGADRGADASMSTIQGTVWSFDLTTTDGEVVLDDGSRVPFGADAFATSGLRFLRPGQRVRLELVDGDVRRVTILTLP